MEVICEFSYKLVLIGNHGVGKSSIVNRLITNEFFVEVRNTVGHANFQATLDVQGVIVEFKIWDTAGQERFAPLILGFLRGCDVCMIVASVTDPSSVADIKKWGRQISESGERPSVLLLINKMDLAPTALVSRESIEAEFAEKYHGKIYFVSAKLGDNINEAFMAAAHAAMEQTSVPASMQLIATRTDEKTDCCG
jgi:small GTP-binding protein